MAKSKFEILKKSLKNEGFVKTVQKIVKYLSKKQNKQENQNTQDRAKQVGKYWDSRTTKDKYWWNDRIIIRHINQIVSGEELDGLSQGLVYLTKKRTGNKCFNNGISVGCGTGQKEMELIKQNVVKHFELYELSQKGIDTGKQLYEKAGLSNHVNFYLKDPLKENIPHKSFDFVHWNNSLHHMFDVDEAVKWSYKLLKKGGMFYMDDYIGPNRFQWSDKMLDTANSIRALIPEKYFIVPDKPTEKFSRKVYRANLDLLHDPSEAVQSELIIDSVKKYFPDAEVIYTGGVMYHLALQKILINFDENNNDDANLLKLVLAIDKLCIDVPKIGSHYAISIGRKK